MRDDDEADIIGTKPKAPPSLLGLPLFEGAEVTANDEAIGTPVLGDALPGEQKECGYCGEPFARNEPRLFAGISIGAAHLACAKASGFRVTGAEREIPEGDPPVWSRSLEEDIIAATLDASDDDAQPPAPHKPEPPTKAERIQAIDRVKGRILARVVKLAESTIGAPEPLAGITAADVYAIASPEPEAAIIGAGDRAWSWLGPWLASLARQAALRVYTVRGHPVRRQSKRKESHGNAHIVYLHPRDPLGYPVEDAGQ